MSVPENPASTPPGPPEPPGPDQPVALGTGPESFEAIPALVREYGDMVRVPSPRGGAPYVVIADPEAIRHVLVANADNYVKGTGFERVKMLLGNGIIVSDGALWRRQRTMMQPGFSRRNIARLSDVIGETTANLRERWASSCARDSAADPAGAAGVQIDLTTTMSEYALAVILKAIFGLDDYRKLTQTADGNPFAFLTDDTTRDLQVAVRFRQLRKVMLEVVQQRRALGEQAGEGADFLSRLVVATDKQGEHMSDAQVLDELMTLIIAGHETSAGTLNWCWYLLSQHPEVEARVLEEFSRVLSDQHPTMEALAELHYTQAVLEETLRMYPPVWVFTRRAVEDDVVAGYAIEAGSNLFISPWLMQHHPAHWSHPGRFDPERFFQQSDPRRLRYVFIPFSAGARRCVGEHFSFVEMKMHLAMLLPHFKLQHQGPAPQVLPGINLRSAQDIHMSLQPRAHARAQDTSV